MTAEVLHFTPRSELGPRENIEAFIELCRNSDVLNARGQFDKNIWDIGFLKGQSKVHRAIFSTFEAAEIEDAEPSMPSPFLEFAKAALVYVHDKRPVVAQDIRVAALRCLDAALRSQNKASRPTATTEDVLDEAVKLARGAMSPGRAYRIAGQLAIFAELMRTKGFAALRKEWHHGMKKPDELGSRISQEALEARQEKLPSAASLRALGGIFDQAVEPRDVLVSSMTALMLCAPERINEVLRLERNCLVEGDGRFAGKLGLRWAGSKQAEDTTKWLPTAMAPIAREAVSNLLKVTAPAQELAEWYSQNPQSLYLHSRAMHLRSKEFLTTGELGLILWGDDAALSQASYWASKTAKIETLAVPGRRNSYRFEDVQRAVLGMLPPTFPYVPGDASLLCRDAIALARVNEMHETRATWQCMFEYVDYTAVTMPLTGGPGDRDTIFDRFDYREDDGSPIRLRSHSLRHYLNMLAHVGGLSGAEIAIFSGRKDLRQNRAYDHMSSDEVQAPISKALKAGFTGTLVPDSARNLILRSEFKGVGTGAAHTTEYGWCLHNFAAEPCQLHRDCMNCEEQVCVKGEAQKEANLRRLKEETELLLARAREALSAQEYGADTWVKHQTKTLERVNALLAVYDDPTKPDGSLIRLATEGAPLVTSDAVHTATIHIMRRRRAIK